jgi:ABC-type transport system involved in multi-copper enzyme maturation permease subunit
MNDLPLPSDGRQLMMALRYHVRGYVRSKRFAIFLAIFGGFGVATALWLSQSALAPRQYDSPPGLLLAGFTWTAEYFAFALAVVFGSDIVSPDLSTPVGLYTLSMPIRRSTLLLGRYLASYLMAMCCTLSRWGDHSHGLR